MPTAARPHTSGRDRGSLCIHSSPSHFVGVHLSPGKTGNVPAKAKKEVAKMGNTMCQSSRGAMETIDVTAPPPEPVHGKAAAGGGGRVDSKTGFHSDVMTDKTAHVASLVHESTMKDFDAKYDLTGGMELGRGACGQVCTVRNRDTNDLFAMKTVSVVDMGSWEDLRNEIDMQKKLDHPNICKIIESFEDKKHGEVYIIMELCTGGSLVSRMKTHKHGYGEALAATFVEKMLSATLYCHHHGVVHRDIKLDNMIFGDDREEAELKLIDFGFAKAVTPGKEVMWDQLGTPSYMAPELWTERETPYDSSVDMWAIGVVTYMLLSGQRPFHDPDKREKARMIKHDPLRFPDRYWSHISQVPRLPRASPSRLPGLPSRLPPKPPHTAPLTPLPHTAPLTPLPHTAPLTPLSSPHCLAHLRRRATSAQRS